MSSSDTFWNRAIAVLGLGALMVTAGNAHGQLLYWVEDGVVRSYCNDSGATDVVLLPVTVGYVRELSVSSGGMSLAAADSAWSQPLTIYHGDVFGGGLKPLSASRYGGTLLASTLDLTTGDLQPLLFWDSGVYGHRVDTLRIDRSTGLPVALTPLRYEIPPGAGPIAPTTSVYLFADRGELYRLLHDAEGSWLQVTQLEGADETEVHPLSGQTWMAQVDGDDLYVVEGDPSAPSVARYRNYWAPGSTREVLLESGDFGPGSRISGIALESRPSEFGDLYVLHDAMISRIPRDGGAAELVHEFDTPAAFPRHDLQAVYMRPMACGRIFGDDDGDGVANWYDECTNTTSGAAVDPLGRPAGDLNADCEVNLSDFAILQNGMTAGTR